MPYSSNINRGGGDNMSKLDRHKGICLMYGEHREDIRNIDLYIIGSEGLNACHPCEMSLVEHVRETIRQYNNTKKDAYMRAKALAKLEG